jgi:hypothetical protein
MSIDDFLRFIVPMFAAIWTGVVLFNREGLLSPLWTTRGPGGIGRAPSGRSRPRRAPSDHGGRSAVAKPRRRDPMWDRDLDG